MGTDEAIPMGVTANKGGQESMLVSQNGPIDFHFSLYWPLALIVHFSLFIDLLAAGLPLLIRDTCSDDFLLMKIESIPKPVLVLVSSRAQIHHP